MESTLTMIDSWALVPAGQTAWACLWFQRTLGARASQQGDSFVGSTRFVKPWKWCRVSHLYFNQCRHGILLQILFLDNKCIFSWLVFFIDHYLKKKKSFHGNEYNLSIYVHMTRSINSHNNFILLPSEALTFFSQEMQFSTKQINYFKWWICELRCKT